MLATVKTKNRKAVDEEVEKEKRKKKKRRKKEIRAERKDDSGDWYQTSSEYDSRGRRCCVPRKPAEEVLVPRVFRVEYCILSS